MSTTDDNEGVGTTWPPHIENRDELLLDRLNVEGLAKENNADYIGPLLHELTPRLCALVAKKLHTMALHIIRLEREISAGRNTLEFERAVHIRVERALASKTEDKK